MKSGVKSIYKPAQIDKTTATTRHLSNVLSKQFFASVFPAVNVSSLLDGSAQFTAICVKLFRIRLHLSTDSLHTVNGLNSGPTLNLVVLSSG